MDRPVSTPAASSSGLEEAPTPGWDARAVWQERIRDPHVAAKGRRSPPRIALEDHSAGWDPRETWRLRVQGPRKNPA